MVKLDRIFFVTQVHKWSFLLAFFVFFTISYAFLVAIDFVPESKTINNTLGFVNNAVILDSLPDKEVSSSVQVNEEVVSLRIPSLNRIVQTTVPASSSLTDLDTALLSGVVRHPDSAKLGEEGNVVILGHSSYLPNILNRNFQALNGIQNLEWGDTIIVESVTTRYVYMVKDVYKVKASEAIIPTTDVGQRLTLVTCNSFATADDRFIVEAELISSEVLE